ncbi:MAG: hypothetical protein WA133_11850 [Syntrophales bacterium]
MLDLIDSTLREGAQTAGVMFNLVQKKAIARSVAAVGIEELELGVASPLDSELPELMAACRDLEERPRLGLWSRCRYEDIRFAAGLRPDVLSLSLPASARHIAKRLGKTGSWVLASLRDSVQLARELGIDSISLGLEDASRADQDFLAELIEVAVSAGVWRIRFADTVGILTPSATDVLISSYRQRFPELELAFHAHNDFGLATANALAALEAGAQWADVTVLGLGERAGCARLEELAAYLTLLKGKKKYRMENLSSLCELVAEAARRSIGCQHPVVGRAIFTSETGLHVQGLLNDPDSYEPFPPERVKACRTILLGAKSGARAVAGYLAQLGLSMPTQALPQLVRDVREQAIKLGRPLNAAEVRSLSRP